MSCTPVLHLQTHFEVVVVHEEEEKCRDAIYRGDAGPAANKAVHTSGNSFTKGRNGTITASRWSMSRWGPGGRVGLTAALCLAYCIGT